MATADKVTTTDAYCELWSAIQWANRQREYADLGGFHFHAAREDACKCRACGGEAYVESDGYWDQCQECNSTGKDPECGGLDPLLDIAEMCEQVAKDARAMYGHTCEYGDDDYCRYCRRDGRA